MVAYGEINLPCRIVIPYLAVAIIWYPMDPDNSDRSIIRYNMNTKRSADMYEHKTYGIWNFMIQKKIDKDSRVYFGIDNIFNHRDDDQC